MIEIPRRGLLLVMSSPSGAGKSTLSRRLLASDRNITMSVSVTTRPPRPGEVNGRDYHFISKEEFARLRDGGQLLEHAEVFGNFYGTPRAPVEQQLTAGKDVLFDIDWQGTQQIAQVEELKRDLVRVFILPPNFRELRARLERRAEDAPEAIQRRLANARTEIGKWAEYDYVIINEDLDRSFPMARAILAAERLRRERVTGLAGFVDALLKEVDESVAQPVQPSR
jgi:guanylate kinase